MKLWSWLQTFPVSVSNLMGDADSPSTESPAVTRWKNELYLCRTLYGGWESVASEAQNLLPQHPAETDQNYRIRLKRPTFYNAFGRTVRALSGTVFEKPPESEGVPPEIQALYDDDIDLQGSKGNTFLHHAFNDGLITGLSGIFVDMPQNDSGKTLQEAQELDIRPFWALIRKDDIVSFRVDIVNGKAVLGQLVLRECIQEPAGAFGVKEVLRYRVLRRTDGAPTFEVWQRHAQTGKLERLGEVGAFRGVTEIPFAPLYTARQDFMDATPPLIDLANLNLLHYQVNSDLQHAAHIANVPFLLARGFDASAFIIGPNGAVSIPGAKPDEANLEWRETMGASIGSTRSILADIEEQMSNLGLGMLQRKSRAAETAEKANIDKKEQNSTLGAMIDDLEDCAEVALFYTAQLNGDPDGKGGKLVFSREFQSDPTSADPTENQGAPKDPKDPKPTDKPVPAGV